MVRTKYAIYWWIAAMWAYWYPTPSVMSLGVGSVMTNVFERSVRAIERCEALSIAGEKGAGTWSVPLSKPEIARRLTGTNSPTRVQTKRLLGLELVPGKTSKAKCTPSCGG